MRKSAQISHSRQETRECVTVLVSSYDIAISRRHTYYSPMQLARFPSNLMIH